MLTFSSLSPSLVCDYVLFGYSTDEVHSISRIFVYLVYVGKFSTWKVCNDFRFCDVSPGALEVIEMVKSCARFYLPLLFKSFRSSRPHHLFPRHWGASSVIGSMVDDRSSFFLLLSFVCFCLCSVFMGLSCTSFIKPAFLLDKSVDW